MKPSGIYSIALVILALAISSSVLASEEASSIMCDNGTVNIGDMDVAVQETCGEPNTKDFNVWVYNFGPDEPVYTVIFDNGVVVRILEDEWGS